MAIKTFTTGEVLTAADTNTYLANSGLVFVKSQTIGSAVSSVDVTSCFTSDYSSYRVVVSNVSSSASNNMNLQLLATSTPAATNYQYGIPAVDYAANSLLYARGQNATAILVGRGIISQQIGFSFDVLQPKSATYTIFTGISYIDVSTGYGGIGAGMHQTATSYDGLRLTPSTGTITGGTILVYGYRN